MPITLLDIAKLNGSDQTVGLIEENLSFSPELERFPAYTISGTTYKIVLRTSYPGVGFRNANEGVTGGFNEFEIRLAQCFLIDGQIRTDKAVADAYERGAAAYQAMDASGVTKQAFLEIGSQVYYGTTVDAKGFPGLLEIHTALNNGIVVDAGGTSAGTGSSVWGIKFGTDGVQMVFGRNTTLELGEWMTQQVTDAAGKYYTAYTNGLTGWVGMQVGSKYSIGRLKDATEDSGKGVTDARLGELLSKYPVGYRPDVWMMNRRGAFQIQTSRSSTVNGTAAKSATGNEVWAPLPTESNGIPIVITDSIVNTETLS